MGTPKVRQCVHLHSLKGGCSRRRVHKRVLRPGIGQICRGTMRVRPGGGLAKVRTLCCSCLCRVNMLPGEPGEDPCTIERSVQGLSHEVRRVRFLVGRSVAAERRLTTCQRPLRGRLTRLVGRHEKLCQGKKNGAKRRQLSRVGRRLGQLHGRIHVAIRVRGRSLRVRTELRRTRRRERGRGHIRSGREVRGDRRIEWM